MVTQGPWQQGPRPQSKPASPTEAGTQEGSPLYQLPAWFPRPLRQVASLEAVWATLGVQSATQMVIREQRAKAGQCPVSPSQASVSPRQRGGKGGAGQTRNPELLGSSQVPSGVSCLPEVDAGSCLFP